MTIDDASESTKHFEAITALATALDASSVAILEHSYHYLAFGSWSVVLGTRHERVRFTWDGKEGALVYSSSPFTNSGSPPHWTDPTPVSLSDRTPAAVFKAVEQLAREHFGSNNDQGHKARITWSDAQVAQGLSSSLETIDPAWFDETSSDEGWSLICRFSIAPKEQGNPSLAVVRFLVKEAPHSLLRAGTTLRLFERGTSRRAIVEILS